MKLQASLGRIKEYKWLLTKGLGTPLLVLASLGMVVLPIPPLMLDILFSFNIALSIVVLLVAVYTRRPLEFAAFPTVLLIATLLRLALNVASTRVVLLEGHNGSAAAGHVIEAFGNVVIGGNYTVGIIVFMILMIINFVVVTKGAGRISEVSARFTLDAMPGKQMAIDADLNAGLINQEEAKKRRQDVTQEADFYGSMDGASKFVKGDAVAGIMILFINILGGFIIGMVQHQLTFSEAAQIYTLLAIGDGLVAQIPSLLLSIAAAIIVTRQNTDQDMGTAVLGQLFDNPKALIISAGILLMMGSVPGMPHLAFLSLGAIAAAGAWWLLRREKQLAAKAAKGELMPASTEQTHEQKDLSWDDVMPVDIIGLEVGYQLIPLVDRNQGGELLNRIKGVRKKLSQELGFLVPAVHIRDNLDLAPNQYRITLMGVSTGEANVYHDKEMAINPGQVFGQIQGVATRDPAFGLEAVWVAKEQVSQAQTLGYTVVDTATVVATHLSQILSNHAALLLGHDEVQQLLDMIGKHQNKLVEGLVPEVITMGNLVKVLQNLLNEGVPIRDMRTILQTLVEYAPRSQDPEVLTAACRIALRRLIVQEIAGPDPELPVITLAPELERILHQSLQAGGGDGAGIEPGLAERMQRSLVEATQRQELEGQPAVLLTSGILRNTLAKFVKNAIPGLRVLSYQEVPDDKQIRIVSAVGQN
ncbi:Flagellar biosynthesis protein FlhA [Aeromonas hydrophila]|uniref:Flagellar biosynthesis protein FlhA n=1 Tax=Aeromonas hydrophila subsp. hydrophila (strain ATCC 7966 / DSM 30187 / BCRC 13018 / CCUG 14551 / JCM 1027 / KCTC 2358 / NCIMB 9240 / NCTC 8049) TaxID=380703 RepID=A0KI17_AERHH|nr:MULTISPECIES: flagellar biosynthesis protein FlhA [Aeromonas]ABK39509.1 flagellar biosynthesis protein FlhA [Aeromonas hydrophila subsp. hydrophila ATCC 7966]ANT68723.1 flagellar biosynthesis protein FlhA [Aeromonas hydrophila]EGX6952396.1 flagellar biosynthesis protein FlhA [Aeromonas hydrophila]EIS3743221.1 flagellar biosynthesis protein FlhA [Aeromonas hydrophila]MBS4670587.1 flagellar biosynthesis protein FlhA [Aeromonas hydrophila]